ncbi:AraC family transcriptional regulator [Halioglobus maricola]|uniref:AraC family transcriptional regulator n=1 Tax=Halioglobus maricola TaxID=2601894 RepID=A0A5P9NMG7_9GAMM|nr:AraC family transcriptional regulator [Halioglobus maricola]QFU76454.1 AraC family transcriptional regulator [Halioglobus maricola]
MQTISPVYARLVLRELEQNGVDPEPMFRGLSLNRNDLCLGGDIALHDFLQILQRGQELIPHIKLGLALGRNAHAFVLGPIGAAMNIAPTVREGLQQLESFTRLHVSYIDANVQSSPSGIIIQMIYHEDTGTLEKFHTETAMLLFQKYVETCTGKELTDARYKMAFPAPDDPQTYQGIFHGEVCFDAECNSVEIPRQWLDLPSPYFHAEMWEEAQIKLSRLLADQVGSANDTFTRHIRALLQSSEPPLPDLEEVAGRLFVSQRTLNRRLQAEGTNYRQLKSAALAERAKAYLVHTSDSVESIAATLAYQDAANFRRAFRKSTGFSPDQFRKNLAASHSSSKRSP